MPDARFVAATDGADVVGTYRSWDTHVTAPGGAGVSADAVSSVAVLPTHRRRGLLRRMITEDLELARERGLPLAVLIAAEAPIYGRNGFGPATETSRWTVDGRTARIAPGIRTGGTVRVVEEPELRRLAPAIHEAGRRPGEIDHRELWRTAPSASTSSNPRGSHAPACCTSLPTARPTGTRPSGPRTSGSTASTPRC